jgi:GMP synthase-like glutamine amidotransferase
MAGLGHRSHILVIDPAVQTPALDCFNRLAISSPLPLTYHLPALHGMGSIESVAESAVGMIVLGSATSVYDDVPWQPALHDWLKSGLQSGIPALGICYGHQLFAHLFGGKVGFLSPDKTKLLGFRSVELDANPLWGRAMKGDLYVAHREVVTQCPADFQAVGRSPVTPFEALAHRKLPIWSFQPHPEVTLTFLKGIGQKNPGKEEDFRFGHRLMQNFVDFVAGKKK